MLYIDELPENCRKCPYFIENGFMCRIHPDKWYKHLEMVGQNAAWKVRDKNCPLRSLTEHNKQIRKEICNEIRKYYTTSIYDRENAHTEVSVLLSRLDQVQGGK